MAVGKHESMTKGGKPCFSQVWTPLVARLSGANITGAEWAVLVALMRFQTVSEDGTVTLSRPSSEIADETGLKGSTIYTKTYELRKHGVLRQVSKGHRGRTATHVLAWRADGSPLSKTTDSFNDAQSNKSGVASTTFNPTSANSFNESFNDGSKPIDVIDISAKTHPPSPLLVSSHDDATGGGEWNGLHGIGLLDRHDGRP